MPEAGADLEPEAGASDASDDAGKRLRSDFLHAIRSGGAAMQLLSAASAEKIGINVTDLNCLNTLTLGGRMTAGDLARETGLTTASITGVLDRLEDAGFVRRERDAHDRRRVIIQIEGARALRDVAPVFAPVIAAWRGMASQYTDEELRLILGFLNQVEQIMRDRLSELRGAREL